MISTITLQANFSSSITKNLTLFTPNTITIITNFSFSFSIFPLFWKQIGTFNSSASFISSFSLYIYEKMFHILFVEHIYVLKINFDFCICNHIWHRTYFNGNIFIFIYIYIYIYTRKEYVRTFINGSIKKIRNIIYSF